MIKDGVHTENTDESDVRKRTGEGEQQLSKIGRQLKGKIVCQRMTQMDTDG